MLGRLLLVGSALGFVHLNLWASHVPKLTVTLDDKASEALYNALNIDEKDVLIRDSGGGTKRKDLKKAGLHCAKFTDVDTDDHGVESSSSTFACSFYAD